MKGLREDLRVFVLGNWRGLSLTGIRQTPISKAAVIRAEKENVGSSKVCHIIGSGWSLAESMSIIKPNDYVVGYNLAALSGICFDSYHIERINERVPGINQFYSRMLKNAAPRKMYIKNLYERGAMVESINIHVDYGCIPYKTFNSGGYFRKGEERRLCNYLIEGGGSYLMQYKSSLILLSVLYMLVGFRTIVLHGQDLSGPYFFDVAEFPLAKEMNPRSCGILPKEVPQMSSPHQIDQVFREEPQIMDVLPVMTTVLRERGVALMSASERSPISRHCPVYSSS